MIIIPLIPKRIVVVKRMECGLKLAVEPEAKCLTFLSYGLLKCKLGIYLVPILLIRLSWRLNESMHVKHLKQCLIHDEKLRKSPGITITIITTMYQVLTHLNLTKTLWGVNFSLVYKKHSFLIVALIANLVPT